MEDGEKEMRKAFEETTTNNVRAIVEHSNTTRKVVREMQDKVDYLESQLQQNAEKMEEMRLTMVNLQMKIYTLEARV